jgi:hypothetical protein
MSSEEVVASRRPQNWRFSGSPLARRWRRCLPRGRSGGALRRLNGAGLPAPEADGRDAVSSTNLLGGGLSLLLTSSLVRMEEQTRVKPRAQPLFSDSLEGQRAVGAACARPRGAIHGVCSSVGWNGTAQ